MTSDERVGGTLGETYGIDRRKRPEANSVAFDRKEIRIQHAS